MSRNHHHALASLLFGFRGPPQAPLPPMMVYMMGLDDPLAAQGNGANDGGGEDDDDDDDDDDHDSQASDDETNVMDPGDEINPAYAADLLGGLIRKYPRYRLRDLQVDVSKHPRSAADEASVLQYRQRFPHVFHRLVDGLAGYRRIVRLSLRNGNFWDPTDNEVGDNDEDMDVEQEVAAESAAANGGNDNDDDDDDDDDDENRAGGLDRLLQPDADDLENLFGTVLFAHARLDYISISASRIQTKYWRLYTETFPTTGFSLFRLMLDHIPLTTEDCRLLQHMLQRQVQLSWLSVSECGLGNAEWRALCEGVAHNPHTHTFMIAETKIVVQRDTLLPLLRAPSKVSRLAVCAASWSDDDHAFEAFVAELRTNTILMDLRMHARTPFVGLHAVEKLLRTYNFTLEALELHPFGRTARDAAAWSNRIEGLLKRNRRVRALFRPKPSDSNPDPVDPYHLSRRSGWNVVLREYSRFPTLLYRFIRTSNLSDFIDQVQQRHHHHQKQQQESMKPQAKRRR